MDSLVVTGATGMTGVALIKEAVVAGKKVVAVVRPNSSNIHRLPSSSLIHVMECELNDLASLNFDDLPADSLGSDRVFFHFGWGPTDRAGRLDPKKQSANIDYSLEAVLLAARLGCTSFVGAGSQAEYGIHRSKFTSPDSPIQPNTAYGVSKYAAGRLCAMAANEAGMGFAWVRIFSLYGMHEASGTMVQSLLPKLLSNEPCELTAGTQLWDYLNVEDAGRAFLAIGESIGKNVRTYCLGSGHAERICDYVTMMRDAIGSSSELLFGAVPYEFGVPNGMCADISTLTADTGWSPRIDFAQGIKAMLAERG